MGSSPSQNDCNDASSVLLLKLQRLIQQGKDACRNQSLSIQSTESVVGKHKYKVTVRVQKNDGALSYGAKGDYFYYGKMTNTTET